MTDRARAGFWVCIKLGLVYMAVACPVLWVFSGWLMGLFSDNPDVVQIGVSYLRVDGLILPLYMALFSINAFLQALKKPGMAFWIGFYRQALAMPLFIWIWVQVLGIGVLGVWLGIATSVATGLIVALALLERVARPRIGSLLAFPNPDLAAQKNQ